MHRSSKLRSISESATGIHLKCPASYRRYISERRASMFFPYRLAQARAGRLSGSATDSCNSVGRRYGRPVGRIRVAVIATRNRIALSPESQEKTAAFGKNAFHTLHLFQF